MSHYLNNISLLYVEDDPQVREGYERALRRHSRELYVAKDGREGLECFRQHHPDIVITDIKMPNINGIEMARAIKSGDPGEPIIFTTAHTEAKYMLEALDIQAEGYLTKPIDKARLLEKLESIAGHIVIDRENRKHQRILQSILDRQYSLAILTDFKTVVFASSSFLALLDVPDKAAFAQKYPDFVDLFVHHASSLWADSPEAFLWRYRHAADVQRVVLIAVGKQRKTFHISVAPIHLENEDLFVVSLVDITQMQKEKLRAQYDATHDELTKVYNRTKFEELFKKEFYRSRRYFRALSMAIVDIDRFKQVNDRYGHLVGDQILKKLAGFCVGNVRKSDLFARWGGEEFVLLLVETAEAEARIVCENLFRGIEAIDFAPLPTITVSIGMTQMHFDDSKESFFARADKALYDAKRAGRSRIAVC